MRNSHETLKPNPESQPIPANGPAIHWLRGHLGPDRLANQSNGRLPRWGRTYADGSRLKLFLNPSENTLEVGYYTWPPGKSLLLGCNQENLDRYDFAAGVIHEFMPEWYRSKNLIYACEETRPSLISSSQSYGVFRDHRHMFENLSPVLGSDIISHLDADRPTNGAVSKEYALTQLAKNPPPPLPIPDGDRLIEKQQTTDIPRLAEWLEPIMRKHHDSHLPGRMRVGYYGPVDGFRNGADVEENHYIEESRSVIATRIMSEFMPGWAVRGGLLVPEGFKLPSTSRMEGDGYRICRGLVREYLTYVEPWRDHSRDLIPRYWANLKFFEMRDRAAFKGGARIHSLPYDIIQDSASIWTRTYPDGSQLRIIYESDCKSGKFHKTKHKDPAGWPISQERLDVHNKIVSDMVSLGIIAPSPQDQEQPILSTYSSLEAQDRGVAFFWSEQPETKQLSASDSSF